MLERCVHVIICVDDAVGMMDFQNVARSGKKNRCGKDWLEG